MNNDDWLVDPHAQLMLCTVDLDNAVYSEYIHTKWLLEKDLTQRQGSGVLAQD